MSADATTGAGDGSYAFDDGADGGFMAAETPTKPVKGTWLDAFQGEHMDIYTPEVDRIASVAPDDNGLYRFFRSLS